MATTDPAATQYAFRCRTCNSLEEAGQAGESATPKRCRICGAGGSFDPKTGLWLADPANWTVLADLPPEELQPILDFHALTTDEIAAHTPFVTTWVPTGETASRDVEFEEHPVVTALLESGHVERDSVEHDVLTSVFPEVATKTIEVPYLAPVYTPVKGPQPPRTPQVIEVSAGDTVASHDANGGPE